MDSDGEGSLGFVDTYFVYDGTPGAVSLDRAAVTTDNIGQIVLQFDDDSQGDPELTHRYLWGPAVDQILADEQVTDPALEGDVLWALTDHLGTVRDLAEYDDSTGVTTVANHRTYDAFGRLVSETNAAIDHLFAFTGRALDDSTGLQNNLNRWYDPVLGRWIGIDPICFEGGDANLYRYVHNNPAHATDPSGLAILEEHWKLINLYKQLVSQGVSDDLLVKHLVAESLRLNHGDTAAALAMIMDVRQEYHDDDNWACADHFLQSWEWRRAINDTTVYGHLQDVPVVGKTLFGWISGAWADFMNLIYSGAKTNSVTKSWLPQDTEAPPTPGTWNQFNWGHFGTWAAVWFEYDGTDMNRALPWLNKVVPDNPRAKKDPWDDIYICFPAGTKVHTETGLQDIETISAGTKVWAFDIQQQVWLLMPVLALEINSFDGPMVTVQLEDEEITATNTHPFWVVSGENLRDRPIVKNADAAAEPTTDLGRWVASEDLAPGDQLLLRNGEPRFVKATCVQQASLTVYNISVEEYRNYAVGSGGILVHNT